MDSLLSIRVPATSANLGSGFDAMGFALSLYNIFKITELLPQGEYKIEAKGEGAKELTDPKNNLVVRAYEKTLKKWGVKGPGFTMWCHNIIPLCRGLGSSSSAVVAGVLIAKHLTNRDVTDDELITIMTEIEGHPDNVAPCFKGGMVVSCWDKTQLRYVKLPALTKEILCVVAVPEERVSTSDARSVLPETVSFEDAVFNLGRAALLASAWATGKWEHLKWGMEDKLHQPYRNKLFSGGDVIFDRVKELPECLSVAISGSGPSVIAFVEGSTVSRVANAMCKTFTEHGVRSQFYVLEGTENGAEVKVSKELHKALQGMVK